MKYFYLVGLYFSFSMSLFGQASDQENKDEIKRLIIESFDEIWSELDSKNIGKFYTDDFLLLENGEVWSNDTISKYLSNARLVTPLPKRVNNFDFLEIKIVDRMAWIAYHN